MTRHHRKEPEIVYDIITVIKKCHGSIKPTRLVQKANLGGGNKDKYFNLLKSKMYVIEGKVKGNTIFVITEPGDAFYNNYEENMRQRSI